MKFLSLVGALVVTSSSRAFAPLYAASVQRTAPSALFSSAPPPDATQELDEAAIQWELLRKHHAKGSWKGIWTSYNYIGDVIDETVASVDLDVADDKKTISQTHTIVVGAKRSDCATCFDSMETKSFPVAKYTAENMLKSRTAASSMVNGPSLLKSGVMATELILSHGDGRLRVTFQHAPVWAAGVEPGSCPPQGLKLFRCMISREALRATAPTAETEAADVPAEGNPTFYRPVPPFDWHKKWGGTAWTWGPQAGDRGWSLEELDDEDAWHGTAPPETWNLRLQGGIFVQAPRVITEGEAGLCRLAWLPDSDTLLRVETGVTALQPMFMDDDTLAGFEPPSLASLRCDILDNLGDLEGEPDFATKKAMFDAPSPEADATETTDSSGDDAEAAKSSSDDDADDDDSGLQAIRNAMSL